MPNPERASYFPKGVSSFVPDMQLHSEVDTQGQCRALIDAVVAANATGILSAQSIATAVVNQQTFAATYTALPDGTATYGRNVTVVASGAATSLVTVAGRDYLGQPMKENFTLNGTTPVVGKKAFKYVDRVDAAVTAATTINVGWGNALGLPFCSNSLIQDTTDNVLGTAGTFVTADKTVPATATTGDTRGTLTPNLVPNGTRTYQVTTICDKDKLHGVRHFF